MSEASTEAYLKGLRDAWNSVDELIKVYARLPHALEGHTNEQRNGMVLACNEIMKLLSAADDGWRLQ